MLRLFLKIYRNILIALCVSMVGAVGLEPTTIAPEVSARFSGVSGGYSFDKRSFWLERPAPRSAPAGFRLRLDKRGGAALIELQDAGEFTHRAAHVVGERLAMGDLVRVERVGAADGRSGFARMASTAYRSSIGVSLAGSATRRIRSEIAMDNDWDPQRLRTLAEARTIGEMFREFGAAGRHVENRANPEVFSFMMRPLVSGGCKWRGYTGFGGPRRAWRIG